MVSRYYDIEDVPRAFLGRPGRSCICKMAEADGSKQAYILFKVCLLPRG